MFKPLSLFFIFLVFATLKAEDNRILVCENSLEMVDWDLKFIAHAKRSIEFSPCYTGGAIFQRFLNAIEKRMEECETLETYILASPVLQSDENKEKIKELLAKFEKRFHYQDAVGVLSMFPETILTDNHVKCLVVDGLYFSAGGTNLHDCTCQEGTVSAKLPLGYSTVESFPSSARDQDIVGKGPIAKEIRENFYLCFSLWEHHLKGGSFISDPKYFKDRSYIQRVTQGSPLVVEEFDTNKELITVPYIEAIFSGPFREENPITLKYEELIGKAKREIVIGNYFICPKHSLLEALMGASQRGVEITAISNGAGEKAPFFCQLVGWTTRSHYVPLFYGREFSLLEKEKASHLPLNHVHIYEYDVFDVLYHKKIMVVDKRYVVIGSYNLTERSHKGDYEMVLFIDSTDVAAAILKVLERDKTFSKEITPEEAREWYFNFSLSYKAAVQKQLIGAFG